MPKTPQDIEEERNRPHPRERFAKRIQQIDLDELSETIRQEPLSSPHVKQGHRQIVLTRELPQTIALYHFEPEGYLKDHQVDAISTLHVLDGCLRVETDEDEYRLEDDEILILEEDVPHSVTAEEETRMLLSINWQGE